MSDILIIDGWCNLCNWLSKFVRKRQSGSATLEIIANKSDDGRELIETFTQRQQDIDTVYLLRNGIVYVRSAAAIRVLLYMKWYYRILFPFAWCIPLPIRDLGYIIVSKSRTRIFGIKEDSIN